MRALDRLRQFIYGSIRHQLALAFALSTGLLMMALVYLSIDARERVLTELSGRSAEQMAQVVAGGAAAEVAGHDMRNLEVELVGVARDPNIRYATVLGADGRVLAALDRALVGTVASDAASKSLLAMTPPHATVLGDTPQTIDAAAPIMARGQLVGWVRIGWSRVEMQANLRVMRERGAVMTLIALALAIVTALMMSGRLTGGLRQLIVVATAVQRGRRDMRAKLGRADEIGVLARTINGMLDALVASERELAKRNEELRVAEERWRFALEGSGDGLWDRDVQTGATFFSKRWKEMLGVSDEDLAAFGGRWEQLVHPDDLPMVLADLQAKHAPGDASENAVEFRLRCKDGRWKWMLGHAMIVREDADGRALRLVGTHTDIDVRKAHEDEIKQLAFFDTLTQLPNRRLLQDRLRYALAAAARNARVGALLFIDLDNFKTLNDTLGHDKGDLLLQQVAARLVRCVREGDTVARLGGDEFVVMLEGLSREPTEAATQSELVGRKILATLGESYELADVKYQSTSSIGIALFENRDDGIDELMKRADLAMYNAKTAGRNTLRFFDPQMQTVVSARAALEHDLREGLEQGQFLLYYQAQIGAGGAVTGAEALVRWRHPQRGMVAPNEFIALSEETGLILPLGLWVLETACAQLVAWAADPRRAHLTVAVNISVRQFRQNDFVDQVGAVLARSGANPERLKLELTESLLMEDIEAIVEKMVALRARGVGFALDDFGTGYSSLSYLKRLPFDLLKIDQSFVRDLTEDSNDAAIASTIVALARHMDLDVIAEGVETREQRDFLASIGCLSYQGYLFARPLPLAEFERLPAVLHAPPPAVAA